MMTSDEEAIRMLEMRMRHQANPSLEKDIVCQNIQYYVSSVRMREEGERREARLEETSHAARVGDRKTRENDKLPAEESERLPAGTGHVQKVDEMPTETRHVKKIEELPTMPENVKGFETMEAQQARGKSEYEKIRQLIEFGNCPDERGLFYLDEKG